MKKRTTILSSVCSLLCAGILSISSFSFAATAIDAVDAAEAPVVVSEAEQNVDTEGSSYAGFSSEEMQQFSQNIEIALQEQQASGYGEVGPRVKGASNTDRPYTLSQATQDGIFVDLSAYKTFEEAKSAMQQKAKAAPNTITKNSYVVRYASRVVAMMDGMVIALGNGSSTLSFNNTYGGRKPYVSLGATMYYVDATSLSTITSQISGVTVQTSYDKLMLVPAPFMSHYANASYQKNNFYERDYYSKNDSGDLVHTVTTFTRDLNKATQYEAGEKTTSSSFSFDKAPSFMSKNQRYYSMNGFDFYTDPFLKNKAGTFYSYYKYLSFHSQSTYSAAELNAFLNNKLDADSMLRNTGQDFITAQNQSGVNALLEVAFAIHESGRGTSSIARNKNNVFGINANDSNPSEDAYRFATVSQCILEHAEIWIKQRYLDAMEDSRYFGAHAGNKAAGINVAYASDAYHGEKIAGWAYRIDKSLGGKDYGRYTIGLAKNSAPIYHSTDLTNVLYALRNNHRNVDLAGLPVLILQKSANSTYQVQLDLPLSSPTTVHFRSPYSFDHVGYVKQSDILVIKNNGFTNGTIQKRTSSITYDPTQQVQGATEDHQAGSAASNVPSAEDSTVADSVEDVANESSPMSATPTKPSSQQDKTALQQQDPSTGDTSAEQTRSVVAVTSDPISTEESASASPLSSEQANPKLKGSLDEVSQKASPISSEDVAVGVGSSDTTLLAEQTDLVIQEANQVPSIQPVLEREPTEAFVQTSDQNTPFTLLVLGALVLISLGGVSILLWMQKRPSHFD